MKHKNRECTRIARQICDRLGESMDSPRCAAIRKHIADCDDCRSYLKGLETVVRLYRRYPIPPLSPAARTNVRKQLKSTRRS